MMNRSRHDGFSRRGLLRGLGVALTLPPMESIRSTAFATEATGATAPSVGTTESGAPLRMAFLSIPNGVQQEHWFPSGDGKQFELNSTMKPLENLKSHLQVISGLGHEHATAGRDGAGDHARANATFLTGARARKTSGRDIWVGTSVDQVAAQSAPEITRFSSLELTCDAVRNSGGCDSGYACAYQFNISWSSPTTPKTPDPNPRSVFERLFGEGSKEQRSANYAKREATQRSVLDFVLEDANQLQRQLAQSDQRKLDEYLESVRELEKRVLASRRFGDLPNPNVDTPEGIPATFADHIDLMCDMLVLAFQTDSTRVATLLMANDGSNRIFPEIGVPEGHHHLSHNQFKEDLAAKVAKIDLFYATRFARFLEKLDAIKDVDGNSVLHNSMIVYGGAIADGNRHTHHNLPVILAGHAGGRIETGRYLKLNDQPMSNLFVSMLNHFGIRTDSFGDSTGRVEQV